MASASYSQTDTSGKNLAPLDSVIRNADTIANPKKADSVIRKHSPKKAALRSAILPGWGQAYNKKYWKIPLVYAALGTTGYIFFDNLTTYRDLRFAYKARVLNDTALIRQIKPEFRAFRANDLQYYRDEFRRNIDYSVLFFLVFWGLNVVDATVDAHLKTFDVSPDLSLRFKAGYSEFANTNGVSLVLSFK